jgi:hypothetical protein
MKTVYFLMKKRWLWYCLAVLLALPGGIVYPQSDAGRVQLEVSGGKAYVQPDTAGLKDPNARTDIVWITAMFNDPAMAHSMVAIVVKGDNEAEVNLVLEGRYARGSTLEFKGTPVVGTWDVRIKGEPMAGFSIFMTIDCVRGAASPNITPTPTPTPTPRPVPNPTPTPGPVIVPVTPNPTPTPTPRPNPPSNSGNLVLTPEMQFQALTRLLIRKGVISAPELVDELQKVSQGR